MNKKRICFIAQFPPPIHGLSKAIDTLYNSGLNDEFVIEKVDIKDNKSFLSNLKHIGKSDADLFYFTISQTKGGNLRDLIILKLLSLQKKKCLIHLHGGYYRQLVDNDLPKWQKEVNYKAIRKLDGAIVLSDSLKNIFINMLPEEKIYVVPNCVDDEFLLNESEIVEKLSELSKKSVLNVMYLSNFIRTKGYPEVLEMARMEKERVTLGNRKRFHFVFAGEFFKDSDKEYFENYVKENKLHEYVSYYGVVQGEMKKYLLKQCDIFVLLTRYPNEGQPISILESMSNAMFIVTTDHAGIPDIVKEGINGIVATEQLTTKSVYQKLLSCSNQTFCEVNDRNQKYCKTMFSKKKYIDSIRCIFEKLS